MKQGMKIVASVVIVAAIMTLPSTKAQELKEEPRLMRATAYTGGTVTASGCKPYEGICSTKEEYINDYVAVVYQAIPDGNTYQIGDVLWILECKDTGGQPIKDG